MRKQRIDGETTRRNLLEAAGRIFSVKGYWKTTNADICRQAGVNAASVNYHFGSKEVLYVESWRYSFKKSIERHPPDGGVSRNAPPEQKLRGQITAMIRRVMDPDSYDLDIVVKEMANPTGLLSEVMQASIGPLREEVEGVVREILGNAAFERQITFCRMSIIGQCLGPLLKNRYRKGGSTLEESQDVQMLMEDTDAFADHITRFSLAGIYKVRDGI